MTVIEEIHQQKATIAALTAENAKLKAGTPAQATAQADTNITTREQAVKAYEALPSVTIQDARARAAFRAKHGKLLGL